MDVPDSPPQNKNSKDTQSSKSEHRARSSSKDDTLTSKSDHRGSPKSNKSILDTNCGRYDTATPPANTGARPNRANSSGSTRGTVEFSVAAGGKARRIQRRVSKRSKFEEGLQVIDELLKTGSDTYKSMTAKQRNALASVKDLLLGRNSSTVTETITSTRKRGMLKSTTTATISTSGNMISHIPKDLILEQRKERKRRARARRKVLPKNAPRMIQKRPQVRRTTDMSSCFFILEEYAGIKSTDDFDDEDGDDGEEPSEKGGVSGKSLIDRSGELSADCTANQSSTDSVQPPAKLSADDYAALSVPHEFKGLSSQDQKTLCDLLSWESLSSWDKFDIFALNDVTKGNPLFFMGWAVLGSPYAQSAMKLHISGKTEDKDPGPGYAFVDDFKFPPDKLCNYLRAIQKGYHPDNPYHNAIHAADVVQSLHTLIQMALSKANNGSSSHVISTCPKIQLFAILLAAVVHDVDHPGKNNAYQTKVKSELAILYNDLSVLENWHTACAFARMLDMNILQNNIQSSQGVQAVLNSPNKNSECNLLCRTSEENFDTIRRLVVEAVLHTDMTKHFAMVNSAKGLVMQIQKAAADGHDKGQDDSMGWNALMYLFHMADISNQAKPGHLARLWTDRCMSEFFKQGKQEAKLGIPISPLCDEATTSLPESQVGFIKFVVQPAYAVLGDLIGPVAQELVVPNVQANLNHWTKEKQLQEGTDGEETVCTSDDDDDLLSVDE